MAASGRLIDYLGVGLASARPAAPNLVTGAVGLWYSTDTQELDAWDGLQWTNVGNGGASFQTPSGGFSHGALLVYDASVSAFVELPQGTPGDVLTANASTVPSYQTPPGAAVSSVNGQVGAVSLALSNLTDVMPGTGGPAVNDVLTWTGSAWEGQQPASAPVSSVNGLTGAVSLGLDQLDDVLTGTGSPANGEVLTWQTDHWEAQMPASAPVSSVNGLTGAVSLGLDQLDDVLVGTGSPADGEAIVWATDHWEAQAVYRPGGTDVAIADGGTGASTAAAARAALQVGQVVLAIACSDETTALTVGANKVKFINPYGTAFNVTAVVASLSTAQTSGSILTVDVNEAGTSILSTKLTIDNTETNSSTAATPPVISDASIAAYAEIEVDIDQVGDGTAKGLKVYLIGYPS